MLVTTTYLEQGSPEEVRAARVPAERVDIVQLELPSPEFARFLYGAAGGDWHWTTRLPWTREMWLSRLSRPMVETWVAWVRGAPAGYIELEGSSTGEVEISYFGLLPGLLGRGLGGHLLTVGLGHAWTLASRWPGAPPANRVWVHTCTLDSPAALANYQARGMVPYRTEDAEVDVPASPPGSWPAS